VKWLTSTAPRGPLIHPEAAAIPTVSFLAEALKRGRRFDRHVGRTRIAPEDETKFFSQM
jgi:hypothetical protein